MSTTTRPSTAPAGWTVLDVSLKVALVALLGLAVWHDDWARFADKAMQARAVAYPLLVGVPVLVWWARRAAGRGPRAYPGLASAMFTAPFVVDVAGNALDLYDRVDRFDDACHYLNWVLLCGALGVLLVAHTSLPRYAVAGLCTGAGAVVAIGWELAEYQTFVTDTPEQFTLYRDTLGDLALGLAGSLTAGVLCACLGRAARRDPVTPTGRTRRPA